MVAPDRTWLERAAAFGRAGTLVLFAAVLARGCVRESAALDRQIAALAAQDRVITIRGGDVSLRDAPKAHELRHGRFFSDPYYGGEHHWYPFITPLAAAAVSKLGGGSVPESFFRAEMAFVALYLAALGALVFVLLGWPGLLLLPPVIWLGALPAAHGLYPTESSRAAFVLFLAGAGLALDGPLSPRRALALGAGVGVLGLWSGAPFFLAAGVAGAVAVAQAVRQPRPRELWRWLVPMALGALIPLALLFAPQFFRHGGFAMPSAARSWMADIYDRGTLARALTFPLAPRGIHLALVLLPVGRLLLGRRLGLPCWRRAIPLVLAYYAALLLAHLGFVAADAGHPALARAARAALLAPAHTFLKVADACRPALEVLGLAVLLELAGLALARLGIAWRAAWSALVPAASLVAFGVLLFTLPPGIARFDASETRAFDRFAARVGTLVDDRGVFFRYPGRIVQGTSVKILRLSVDEYANPYAHLRRARDAEALDAALAAGDTARADGVLDRYGIAFVMEDPRAPTDPVIRRCAGAVLAEQDGYRLRQRTPCAR
jgi:hypothetical protein